MPESDDQVRKALAAAIGPLVTRYGGPPAVAERVGVHRSRVNQWVKGKIPLDRVGHLAVKLGEDITVRFPAHGGAPDAQTEKPPPEWAEALMRRDEVMGLVAQVQRAVTDEVKVNRDVIHRAAEALEALADLPELLSDYRAALERLRRQADGGPGHPSPPSTPGTQGHRAP